MKAKFVGKSSMGFVTGKIYNIRSKIQMVRSGGLIFGENIMCICIYDNNSNAWCPYESLEAVMNNWVFDIKNYKYSDDVTRDILTGKGLKPLY